MGLIPTALLEMHLGADFGLACWISPSSLAIITFCGSEFHKLIVMHYELHKVNAYSD